MKTATLVLRGTLRENEPMARHTSWRVGGPAQHFFQPADMDDLAVFLRQLPETELVSWLGLGSNLLVRDGGLRGAVIAVSGLLNRLEQTGPHTVRAEAGVTCAKVARYSARLALSGAEFLAGVPGTMGGALAMNAGAFGGETWQIVKAVETMDRQGAIRKRTPQDFEIGYRHVVLRTVTGEELGVRGNTSRLTPHASLAEGASRLTPHAEEWFVAAELQLQTGERETAEARIKELLEKRNLTQPTHQPSAGSVFRNPPGDHAARLIEACGLKGFCIGGACVSEKHANFIINTGNASAADIEALIAKIAGTVEQQRGVRLIPEVRIVGERPPESPGRGVGP
ncbi:MAG: UDP-N-acetylmuramate dehydrogenase [Gammaproteobacteria bacterium]|nr:UDP-N-acetylmuramate dehydrogenase [Gammaproteobacteria bacterium]